jgi:hypothetical protein
VYIEKLMSDCFANDTQDHFVMRKEVVGSKIGGLGLEQRSFRHYYMKVLTPIPKLGCLLGTVTVEWEEGRVL